MPSGLPKTRLFVEYVIQTLKDVRERWNWVVIKVSGCLQSGCLFVVVFFLKKKTNQSILIAFNSYIPVIFLKLEQFPHLVSLFS